MHSKSTFKREKDLEILIEETFDLCITNRDEIYWLICLIRSFLNIPNKRVEPVVDNFRINRWQQQLHPIVEIYKKRYNCSNY